jgi:hypothetical protein
VLYRRPFTLAQSDLGTVYCSSWNTILGPDGCSEYKNFSTIVETYDDVIIEEPASQLTTSEWTTTGLFAVPGKPIEVARLDTRTDVATYVNLWYQRVSTTKSLQINSGITSNYDRPQYLRSPNILVPASGETITIVSPYGGPIYVNLQLTGNSKTSSLPVRLKFSNVGKHPALTDVSDDTVNNQFGDVIRSNPIPIVDIRFPGFEMHMRSDYFLASLKTIDFLQDYSGSDGISKIIYDVKYNFVQRQYTLAGFKVAGMALKDSLSPDVLLVCEEFNWNCTDINIHTRSGIQHANYDGKM